MSGPDPRAPWFAAGLVSIGVGVFTCQDVIIRTLSGTFSVWEIVFFRTVFALILLQAVRLMLASERARGTTRLGEHLFRGLLMVCSYAAYYLAIASMPLLEAVTIFFTAPLLATGLSALILREHVGPRRWSAIAIGFAGMLLMIRPGAAAFQATGLVALLAAALYASSVIVTRRLGATETGLTMTFYAMLVYLALACVGIVALEVLGLPLDGSITNDFLVRTWVEPGWTDLGLLALAGLAAVIGMFCLSQAYRMAAVATVAPFEFTALIWAGGLGYLFWDEVPAGLSVLGAVLIVAAGTYVTRREAALAARR